MGKRKEKKIDLKNLLLGSSARKGVHAASDYPNGTQNLIPISDIGGGVIQTSDGRYVKIIEVLPTNFYLKSNVEKRNIIYYFSCYLKIAPPSLQILVRTQHADIDAYCSQMEEYYNTETNENCKAMILENAEMVNYLATYEAVTRRFYLVFDYQGSSTDFEQIAKEMNEQAEIAYQYLDYCGLEAVRHDHTDQFHLRTLYTILNPIAALNTNLDSLSDQLLPVCESPEYDGNLDEEDLAGKMSLQDLLAPTEYDLTNSKYIVADGLYYSYLYLTGYSYPTRRMGAAWLSPLVELGAGISISFYLDRKRKDQILPKISKSTMINRTRIRDVEDTRSDYEELDDAISSGMYLKQEINRENEDFYWMHTLIEVTANSEELLNKRIAQVENLCRSLDLIGRRADYKMEQCYISMLPLAKLDTDIEAKSRRNILTSGAAAAFPFCSYELCDDTGILLGMNLHNNSPVIIDNFNTELYSNGSFALFGTSGAGKTYLLLLLALRLRMRRVRVFAVVPEKGFEYRNACDAVGGQYIKICPGSDDRLNLMEIRRTTLDIDAEMVDNRTRSDSVLLDKIQQIQTFLALRYPQMTPEETYQLNIAILECYESFGITRDNATLVNPDGSMKPMPDFTHLYPFLLKYPSLQNIALVVKELVEFGLGGQTNVDLHSDFIVLDTSSAKKHDISSLTYIATSFVRDEISRSRTTKKAVLADELWKIAGEEGNEQAADFAIELVKTVRGYGGIFVSATQNTIDYFALRNGKFGDSLLNNSRLKLLLQMEEAEALKLKEKLGLTDEETMQIIRSGRGQGLLCAGKNRISVEIRSSQTEHDLITTNRIDLEKRVKTEK